jgi:hypothetical protein
LLWNHILNQPVAPRRRRRRTHIMLLMIMIRRTEELRTLLTVTWIRLLLFATTPSLIARDSLE